MSELRACPACGGEASKASTFADPESAWSVACGAVGRCIMGPVAPTESDAIAAWNALPRKEDAAVLVEALRFVATRPDINAAADEAFAALVAYEAKVL